MKRYKKLFKELEKKIKEDKELARTRMFEILKEKDINNFACKQVIGITFDEESQTCYVGQDKLLLEGDPAYTKKIISSILSELVKDYPNLFSVKEEFSSATLYIEPIL